MLVVVIQERDRLRKDKFNKETKMKFSNIMRHRFLINDTKFLFMQFSCLLILFFAVCNQSILAQCSLINNSRDALFMTFERTAQVKVKSENKLQDGVVLRLHNNSTCAVLFITGDTDIFPPSDNQTVLQHNERKIDDLPDGTLIPAVQYRYKTSNEAGMSVGGDSFSRLKLLGNRSILFEVPFTHFDVSPASKIMLPFNYAWEKENRAKVNYLSVEAYVSFYWVNELPVDIIQKMKKH